MTTSMRQMHTQNIQEAMAAYEHIGDEPRFRMLFQRSLAMKVASSCNLASLAQMKPKAVVCAFNAGKGWRRGL